MKKFIKKQRITNLAKVDSPFKQSSAEASGIQHPQTIIGSHQSDQKHTSRVNTSMNSIEEELKSGKVLENTINSKQLSNSPFLSTTQENKTLSIHPFNQRIDNLSSNCRIQYQQQEESQIGKDNLVNRIIYVPQESQFLQYSQNQDNNWLNLSQSQNNQINLSFMRDNNANQQYFQTNRINNLPNYFQMNQEFQTQSNNNFIGQIFNNNYPSESNYYQPNSILSTQVSSKENQELTLIEMEMKQEITEELQSVKKYFETAIKNEVDSFSQNYSNSEESYDIILKNLTNRIESTIKIMNNFVSNQQKNKKKKKQIIQKYAKEIFKLKEIVKNTEKSIAEQSQNLINGRTELITQSTRTIQNQIKKAKISLKKQLKNRRKYSILSQKRKQGNRLPSKI